MSIEKGPIGTSVGRSPSMTASRPSIGMGREMGSFKSLSISRSGTISEKGGNAMKMKIATPMTKENVTWNKMPVLKVRGAISADRAMPATALKETSPLFKQAPKEVHPLWAKTRPLTIANNVSNDTARPASALKETKPQYQRPKDTLWKNTVELKVNKQAPAVSQTDSFRREKLPGVSAPSLFERRADTAVKMNYPNTVQSKQAEVKKPLSAWEKAQKEYAQKKNATQGKVKPVATSEGNGNPLKTFETAHAEKKTVQPRIIAPRTASELSQRAKEARSQTQNADVQVEAKKLQQAYRTKFSLSEHPSNPVEKSEQKAKFINETKHVSEIKTASPVQVKDKELARVEAAKVMEQAALVLQVAKKFESSSPSVNTDKKLGQERILQLVHETLQKRGLTQYLEEEKAINPQVTEQATFVGLPKVAEAIKTQTEHKTESVQEGAMKEQMGQLQALPQLKTETETQPQTQETTSIQKAEQTTTQTLVKAQNQAVSTQATLAAHTMQQDKVLQQLDEQIAVQTQTQTTGGGIIEQHVKLVNGEYVVEREEIVAERDPEADQERVQRATEVGANMLSEAHHQGQESITASTVVAKMPSGPIGGLVSRIRRQLDLPLDTEKQYDAFKHVLGNTSSDLRTVGEIQSAAKYATDVAPAVRLNTRMTTEPVKLEDHIRAVSEGANIVVFEQQHLTAQAA
jgi:hypothetical protein